jgi:hypothetical protein
MFCPEAKTNHNKKKFPMFLKSNSVLSYWGLNEKTYLKICGR